MSANPNQFSQHFYPVGQNRYPFRTGECTNSFACFKQQASRNWKRWGQEHFEKHHKGTSVKDT